MSAQDDEAWRYPTRYEKLTYPFSLCYLSNVDQPPPATNIEGLCEMLATEKSRTFRFVSIAWSRASERKGRYQNLDDPEGSAAITAGGSSQSKGVQRVSGRSCGENAHPLHICSVHTRTHMKLTNVVRGPYVKKKRPSVSLALNLQKDTHSQTSGTHLAFPPPCHLPPERLPTVPAR